MRYLARLFMLTLAVLILMVGADTIFTSSSPTPKRPRQVPMQTIFPLKLAGKS
ncbi:MAG: hypothetical protein ACKV2V_25225 [Blastocatellia bacterium]